MKKNYYIIIFSALAILVISGCSNIDQKIRDTQENKEQNLDQKIGDDKIPDFEERFAETTISDLAIEKKVLVIGVENADKSILASQIIIGGDNIDLKEMMGPMPDRTLEERKQLDEGIMPPENFQGQRPNFDDFPEMGDEEREEFKERMTERRGTVGVAVGNSASGTFVRLSGEILSQDETGLTLKLEGGGSKIVFFSESIEFKKAKQNN